MQRDTEYYERLRRWRNAAGRRTEPDTEPDDEAEYSAVELPEDDEPKPKRIVLSAAPRQEVPDPWR